MQQDWTGSRNFSLPYQHYQFLYELGWFPIEKLLNMYKDAQSSAVQDTKLLRCPMHLPAVYWVKHLCVRTDRIEYNLHIDKSPCGTLLPCLPSNLLAFKVTVSEGESKMGQQYSRALFIWRSTMFSKAPFCLMRDLLVGMSYSEKQGDGDRMWGAVDYSDWRPVVLGKGHVEISWIQR